MIDTHSHIYSEEFDGDRDEVIARAQAAGIEMIFLPAIDSQSHDRQETLAMSRPDLFRQMMGLHPTSVNENFESELKIVHDKLFEENTNHTNYTNTLSCNSNNSCSKKYLAIGEIGLDFYWDTTYRRQQIQALTRQLQWAEELRLPVVLHLRSGKNENHNENDNDAYATAFEVLQCNQRSPSIEPEGDRRRVVSLRAPLKKNNKSEQVSTLNSQPKAANTFESINGSEQLSTLKGIMHCFSGSLEDARRAVDMGFLLGIGGVITYKKTTLPKIVREVGLGNIVLETDAPYLAPVPYRGKRNESAYLRFVAEKVAETLGVSFDEVDMATTENAKRILLQSQE